MSIKVSFGASAQPRIDAILIFDMHGANFELEGPVRPGGFAVLYSLLIPQEVLGQQRSTRSLLVKGTLEQKAILAGTLGVERRERLTTG